MTSNTWPSPLKLEVKISRTSQHTLSERDLKGITPGGFAAVLITDRMLHGPRWLLLPRNLLQPGSHSDADLCQLADTAQADVCQALNSFWSNWILDETMWAKLFEQEHMKIMQALEWCIHQHPPRVNRSSGNLRESKLAAALQRFQEKLDRFLTSENGPQQEGFIHQKLLAHALTTIGYQLSENPIGVPDITAIHKNISPPGMDALREKLRHWQPSDPELLALRNSLLATSDANLQAVRDFIRS